MERSDDLLDEYSHLLQRTDRLLAESVLPAPKTEIGAALIGRARQLRASAQFDGVRECRTSYTCLAYFVADEATAAGPPDQQALVMRQVAEDCGNRAREFDEAVLRAAGASQPGSSGVSSAFWRRLVRAYRSHRTAAATAALVLVLLLIAIVFTFL